ncbi:FecR domain-containing protein [Leptospira sp. GIMC2001]|uniref:FecR domain-containing protein n=1 Tax=Leptospira sp. GIMC2001 TaxID=1513297 RepID=UPI002349D187|nr:FecR domain-containing protein [Leptospira sp. GIMC2001]WCL49854.1 FecR domain-containing protein [Leptospira sp. GIMC2001]
MTSFFLKAKAITAWKAWEKYFLSFEAIAILILGLLLYADFQRRLDAGTREQIGIISFKQKTVQRKYSDRVVWETMEQSFPLYNQDSIRTGDLSDAEITLNDGTKLEVDENTLIVLNITQAEKEIDFAYGSLSANRADSDGGSGLSIRSGEALVSLDKSDVNLVQEKDKDLVVDVKAGFANLMFGGKENKISDGEKAVISGNETEIQQKPFRVIYPPSNHRVQSFGSAVQVEFTIDGYDKNKNANLEFSRSRTFASVLSRRKIDSEKFKESFQDGLYFWRAVLDGKTISQGRVSVLKIQAPRLVSPTNNAKIFTSKETSLVSFSWIQEKEISQSTIEIASDANFQNIISSKNSRGSSIAVDLPDGSYYWRVRSSVSESLEPVTSLVQNLEVTKEEPTVAPILMHPKSGDVFSDVLVTSSGISFFWSTNKGYTGYELEISQRRDFSDPIRLTIQDKNSLEYKGSFVVSNYYWRVRGITPTGKKSNYSNYSSFSISAVAKNIFNLQSDNVVSESAALRDGVTLRWKKLPVNGTYEVVMAKDKDFKNVVKKLVTNLSQAEIKELSSGKYFWKVSLLDEDGKPQLVSDPRELNVNDSLGPVFPKNGDKVNMSQRNSLKFEWERRSDINSYVIVLYQKIGQEKRQILQKSTNKNIFEMDELDLLDQGYFEWEIYYEESGERRKEFNSNFSIDLDPMPDQLEFLTPKVQYAD